MEQKTFWATGLDDLYEIVKKIMKSDSYKNAHSILLQMTVGIPDPDNVLRMLRFIQTEMPKVHICGMSVCAELALGKIAIYSASLSFLFFKDSNVRVITYDCDEISPADAGKALCDQLKGMDDLVGIQVLATTLKLGVDGFLNEIKDSPQKPLIFGAGAGVLTAISAQMILRANDEVGQRPKTYGGLECFVFGSEVIQKGIVVILFSGKNLAMNVRSNLGWHPIGKEMTVTKIKTDTILAEVDGQPATSIYEKYLNVAPDSYMVQNTCEFPLLLKRNNTTLARVPAGYDEEGCIYLTGDIHVGEKVRLSYGIPAQILKESKEMSIDMVRFEPQAMIVWMCVNRILCLKEDGKKEVELFNSLFPKTSGAYAFAEIVQTKEGGGVLNNALVIAELKETAGAAQEGEKAAGKSIAVPEKNIAAKEENAANEIPFADRILTFLAAITSELEASNHKLEKLAMIDELTGIYNRRKIEQIFVYEMKKREKAGKLCILMFDIDLFKAINDTYGHETGDVVLHKVAQCARNVIRKQDTIGRWGGEEFFCVLPETEIEAAGTIAERIREEVEHTDYGHVPGVTVSVGVTEVKYKDTTESAYERVDRALYNAKKAGRNVVKAE